MPPAKLYAPPVAIAVDDYRMQLTGPSRGQYKGYRQQVPWGHLGRAMDAGTFYIHPLQGEVADQT